MNLYEKADLFNNLNVIEWRIVTARKDHIDEFGKKISCGEEYFKMDGVSWNADKLSQSSMDTFCTLFFDSNPALIEAAKTAREEKHRRMRDAVNSV